MITCNVCNQKVINKQEQSKQIPLCYYHAKVRDGLIEPESDYTFESQVKARDNAGFTLSYKPYVYKQAFLIGSAYAVNAEDLIQEGMLALYEIGIKLNTTLSKGQQVNYILRSVRSKMTDYVAHMSQIVRLSQRALKTDKVRVQYSGFQDAYRFEDAQLPPDEALIQKEEGEIFRKQFKEFVDSLNHIERIVLQRHMLAKKPWTTRRLAKRIGAKSNKTVTNIKCRISNKAKEYFER